MSHPSLLILDSEGFKAVIKFQSPLSLLHRLSPSLWEVEKLGFTACCGLFERSRKLLETPAITIEFTHVVQKERERERERVGEGGREKACAGSQTEDWCDIRSGRAFETLQHVFPTSPPLPVNCSI